MIGFKSESFQCFSCLYNIETVFKTFLKPFFPISTYKLFKQWAAHRYFHLTICFCRERFLTEWIPLYEPDTGLWTTFPILVPPIVLLYLLIYGPDLVDFPLFKLLFIYSMNIGLGLCNITLEFVLAKLYEPRSRLIITSTSALISSNTFYIMSL